MAAVDTILASLPNRCIGVLGDLFLDRYLDLDAALTEPSLETGLDAYQVVRDRCCPGAAGTIISNLVAMGIGRIEVFSVIGNDGAGHELLRSLRSSPAVETASIIVDERRWTPTYMKPWLITGEVGQELNRFDFKNRNPLPVDLQQRLIDAIDKRWTAVDAWVVLDQVSEQNCGVVTDALRDRVAELAEEHPQFTLGDSREHIGLFRSVAIKPNEREARRALGVGDAATLDLPALAKMIGGPVLCTVGPRGIMVTDPQSGTETVDLVEGFPVAGPVDIVGAGDSATAGIVSAMASGATLHEAAQFGNLIASITVQQIGMTGTASPQQIRDRWETCRQ